MSRLYLFDDARARAWRPFACTRPVGELLHGCLLLRGRAGRALGMSCAGHLSASHLRGFEEEGAPPVLAPDEVPADGVRVLLSSRFVPSGPVEVPAPPATLVLDGSVVGWVLEDGRAAPSEAALLDLRGPEEGGARVEVEGELLDWPWSLVARNADRIAADIDELYGPGDSFLLGEPHVLGRHAVSLGEDVSVEPGVIFDVREGPVRLDRGVRVQGPARLTGPLYVGRDSVVFGGSLGRASIGPVCKVRGEVETTVMVGWDNKAHDGYLGHALLGRWVNLGALTTNSDLKNNYTSVRVPIGPDHPEVDTGMLKVGVFLGDHVRTGIGTLLNTGTVVGAGSNVFGGALPPKWVPPFSWGTGEELVEYRLDAFLATAERVMGRRDVALGEDMRALLARVWERTRPERREPASAGETPRRGAAEGTEASP